MVLLKIFRFELVPSIVVTVSCADPSVVWLFEYIPVVAVKFLLRLMVEFLMIMFCEPSVAEFFKT